MLHVSARDRVSGIENKVSVQATQARLTPAEIAEARHPLADIELVDELEAAETEAPLIDEETQALLKRAETILAEGSLDEAQATQLKDLRQTVVSAQSQDELDERAEALLDLLFDLE